MKKLIWNLLIVILIWISITGMIQSFICHEMTKIELLLNTPNSMIFNFKTCEKNLANPSDTASQTYSQDTL